MYIMSCLLILPVLLLKLLTILNPLKLLTSFRISLRACTVITVFADTVYQIFMYHRLNMAVNKPCI